MKKVTKKGTLYNISAFETADLFGLWLWSSKVRDSKVAFLIINYVGHKMKQGAWICLKQ